MRKEQKLYRVVYDYFSFRICLGFYRRGDGLPSIGQAREMFGVSARTVRRAYHMLEEEGYIAQSRGRTGTVLREQDPERCRERCAAYFAARRDAVLDLCAFFAAVMPEVMLEGMLRMEEAELEAFGEAGRRADIRDLQTLLQCFCRILYPLGNPLLLNFFWEAAVFTRLTYLRQLFAGEESDARDTRLLRERLARLLAARRVGDVRELRRMFARLFGESGDYARARLEELGTRHPETEQVPFAWYVHKGRPQQCFPMAMKLIRQIGLGAYPEGAFLPSAAELSGEYGVPVITIRRTLAQLGLMGITETVNGRGTRVLSGEEAAARIDLASPAVRKKLLLFPQTVQIMALTCLPAAERAFSRAGGEALARTKAVLSAELESGTCRMGPAFCIGLITRHAGSAAARELYGQLAELMSWGHALRFLPVCEGMARECRRLAAELLRAVERGDGALFASAFREWMLVTFNWSRKELDGLGIRFPAGPTTPEEAWED